MRERRDDEATVAPGGAVPNRVLLEDDDIPPSIVTLRMKSGPDAGETTADDAEVRVGRAAREWGIGLAGREVREPERCGLSLGVGGAMSWGRRRIGPGKTHGGKLSRASEPTGSVSLERASSSAG